jgi:hypothetical protein
VLQCVKESLCRFVIEDVAGPLGEGALGLVERGSSYELTQGLATSGCGSLLEVTISRVYGIRPDRSRYPLSRAVRRVRTGSQRLTGVYERSRWHTRGHTR